MFCIAICSYYTVVFFHNGAKTEEIKAEMFSVWLKNSNQNIKKHCSPLDDTYKNIRNIYTIIIYHYH